MTPQWRFVWRSESAWPSSTLRRRM
jgi:hypothetical protein